MPLHAVQCTLQRGPSRRLGVQSSTVLGLPAADTEVVDPRTPQTHIVDGASCTSTGQQSAAILLDNQHSRPWDSEAVSPARRSPPPPLPSCSSQPQVGTQQAAVHRQGYPCRQQVVAGSCFGRCQGPPHVSYACAPGRPGQGMPQPAACSCRDGSITGVGAFMWGAALLAGQLCTPAA